MFYFVHFKTVFHKRKKQIKISLCSLLIWIGFNICFTQRLECQSCLYFFALSDRRWWFSCLYFSLNLHTHIYPYAVLNDTQWGWNLICLVLLCRSGEARIFCSLTSLRHSLRTGLINLPRCLWKTVPTNRCSILREKILRVPTVVYKIPS